MDQPVQIRPLNVACGDNSKTETPPPRTLSPPPLSMIPLLNGPGRARAFNLSCCARLELLLELVSCWECLALLLGMIGALFKPVVKAEWFTAAAGFLLLGAAAVITIPGIGVRIEVIYWFAVLIELHHLGIADIDGRRLVNLDIARLIRVRRTGTVRNYKRVAAVILMSSVLGSREMSVAPRH